MPERATLADLHNRLGITVDAEVPAEDGRRAGWLSDGLVAVGAWIAAIALVAAAGLMLEIFQPNPAWWTMLPLSLLGLGAGVGIAWATEGVFPRQFALALALAGLVGSGLAFFDIRDAGLYLAAGATMLLALLTAPAMRDGLYAFLAGVAAALMLLPALLDNHESIADGLYVLLTLPLALALLLRPWPVPNLRPLGLALALAAPVLLALWSGDQPSAGIPQAGARVLYLLAGLGLLALLARSIAPGRRAPWLAAGGIAVAAAALVSAGVAAAASLLLLAALLGSRTLAAFGVLLQAVALFRLYYQIEATLLVKSGLLAAAGAVLLLAWWLVERATGHGREARDALA